MFRTTVGLLLLGMSQLAFAALGTIDKVPGATLLFPHFEVDTSSEQGNNTIITIQNTSATAVLGRVVFWTDQGIPTLGLNIYLTGYDQETIDLRRLFVERLEPRTASDGQDPQDTISPQGPVSQDINFASCNNFFPDIFAGTFGPELTFAHTGRPAPAYFDSATLCGGRNYGDNIARGYITVDAVNQCTLNFPHDPGYFVDGGAGIATMQNVFSGQTVFFDATTRRTYAETAVAIEANPTSPFTSGGAPTFYGMPGSADNREPLPTAWATRFSGGRTSFDYWRQPVTTTGGFPAPFTCGTAPANAPTTQRAVTAYDANGAITGSPTGNLFQFGTGNTPGSSLNLNAPLGWVFVNLNLGDGTVRQSWLTTRQVPAASGTGVPYGYGTEAIQLGNLALGPADPTSP